MSHRLTAFAVAAILSAAANAQFGPAQEGFEPPERRPATEAEQASLKDAINQLNATARDVAAGKAKTDKYLNLIWGGDGAFFREQRAWAADLAKVDSIRFVISTTNEVEVEGDNAYCTLIMNVVVGDQDVTLDLPMEFFRHSAGAGETWMLAGEDFAGFSGSRNNLEADAGFEGRGWELARGVDAVRRHVQRGLGHTVDRMVKVKVYDSGRDMEFMISPALAADDGYDTYFTRYGESIRIAGDSLPEGDDQARAFLTRVFTSYVLQEMSGGKHDVPAWVEQGIGALAAERWADNLEENTADAREWLSSGKYSALASLSDRAKLTDDQMKQARTIGQSLIGYISDEHGRDSRNEWLAAITQGTSPDAAARDKLGTSLEEIWNAWRDAVLAGPAEEPAEEPAPSDDGN